MTMPTINVTIDTITRHTLGGKAVKYVATLSSGERTKRLYGHGLADHRQASLLGLKAALSCVGGTKRDVHVAMREAKGAAYPELHAEVLELASKHAVKYHKV